MAQEGQPQAMPPQAEPAPAGPPPKKGKGAIIGAVVAVIVIVVVLLILFLFVFKAESALVGKWNIDSASYMGQTIDMPEGNYFDFKSDGSVTISFSMMGQSYSQTIHYEDLGGGKVKFKNGGEATSDYSISGSTLTLSNFLGMGMDFTCTKA